MSEGECIFWGPLDEALPFLEGLGYRKPPEKSLPDFLEEFTGDRSRFVAPKRQLQAHASSGTGCTVDKEAAAMTAIALQMEAFSEMALPQLSPLLTLFDALLEFADLHHVCCSKDSPPEVLNRKGVVRRVVF